MATGFAPTSGYNPGRGYVVKGASAPKPARTSGFVPGRGFVTAGGWDKVAGVPGPGFGLPKPPAAPRAVVPKPPQAPAQPAAQSVTAPPAPSPLDSTYFANIAANQFKVNNQINALNQASAYGRTDLANNIEQLQQKEPLDQLAAQVAANRRGALFSTVLGQQLGQIDKGYLTREAGLQDAFTRQEAARQSQIQGLEGGLPLFEAAQAAAAAERASALAQKNPATGESAAPLTPSKAAAAQWPAVSGSSASSGTSGLAKAVALASKLGGGKPNPKAKPVSTRPAPRSPLAARAGAYKRFF